MANLSSSLILLALSSEVVLEPVRRSCLGLKDLQVIRSASRMQGMLVPQGIIILANGQGSDSRGSSSTTRALAVSLCHLADHEIIASTYSTSIDCVSIRPAEGAEARSP